MPKIKDKVLTEAVYVYVRPENEQFLVAECKGKRVSKSLYMDTVLTDIRKGKYAPKVVRRLTLVEKRQLEKKRRDHDNARRRALREKRKQESHVA